MWAPSAAVTPGWPIGYFFDRGECPILHLGRRYRFLLEKVGSFAVERSRGPCERRARVAENCGATVLVVDDDEVCRELVSTLLGRAGLSSVGAANGEEAMAAARRHLPRL